jgi:hypothetical protein
MCGQSNHIIWAEVKTFFLVPYIVGEKKFCGQSNYVGGSESIFSSSLLCGRKKLCGQSNCVGGSESVIF